MIVQPDFLTHWKVQALSGIIGRAEALTALLSLWGHCQNSRTYVFKFTLPMLAGICQYQGNAATLHQAMLDCQLLDELPAGEFEVHGWAEKNATLLTSWHNGNKGGRPTKNPRVNPDSKPENPWVNPDPNSENPLGNPDPHSKNPLGNPDAHSKNPRATHGVTDREIERERERLEKKREGMGPVGPPTSLIFWNLASGWTGFTPELRRTLQNAFPRVDLDLACVEADLWLRNNPAAADKKNWLKFLTNWLTTSSPSGHGNYGGTRQEYWQKNEGGAPPPAQLVRPAPAAPWRAAFAATYGRPPDTAWPNLPPGIQREIKDILAAADPLQLHVWAAQESEGGAAA